MELKDEIDEIVEILNDKLITGNEQKISTTIRTPILNPIINSPKVHNVIEIFEGIGKMVTAGYTQGIERNADVFDTKGENE